MGFLIKLRCARSDEIFYVKFLMLKNQELLKKVPDYIMKIIILHRMFPFCFRRLIFYNQGFLGHMSQH